MKLRGIWCFEIDASRRFCPNAPLQVDEHEPGAVSPTKNIVENHFRTFELRQIKV
jgi:hypothetical protein